MEGDVRFLRSPEVMEQYRQLAGDGHDRLVLRLLATSGREMKTPLPKRRVSAMWPQDMVGAFDQ